MLVRKETGPRQQSQRIEGREPPKKHARCPLIPSGSPVRRTFPMQQAHPWHGVPVYANAGSVNAFIEMVPGVAVKYEVDKGSGMMRLDRPQRYSASCPELYGFVPRTYCGKRV